jgi:hypothetical protein
MKLSPRLRIIRGHLVDKNVGRALHTVCVKDCVLQSQKY